MRTSRGTGGCVASSMLSVFDGSVRIEAEDRAGLERLVRYCSRRLLALERLHAPAGIGALTSPEARLLYRLPEPDLHGCHELRLTPLELLERLARPLPPPRIHRHRDHGVLAPNARLRSEVVTIGRPVPDDVTGDMGPPQAELEFDQSPTFDLAALEAFPEFEFDQSSARDWDI